MLLLALLCLVKLQFTATYTDTLVVKLRVLFIEFAILPRKKVDKKKPEKKVQKSKSKKSDKPKKKSYLKKLSDKKGLDGLVSMVVDLAKLAGTTLKGLFEKIVITRFDINITVVGENAADTALKYGKLCGAFYSAVYIICSTAQCEQYNLNVTPDFDDEAKMQVVADTKFYIRVFYVLKYGLKALYKLLLIRYRR